MTLYLNCSGCQGKTTTHSCGRSPKARLLPQSFYDATPVVYGKAMKFETEEELYEAITGRVKIER